jgi:hypothetical protein
VRVLDNEQAGDSKPQIHCVPAVILSSKTFSILLPVSIPQIVTLLGSTSDEFIGAIELITGFADYCAARAVANNPADRAVTYVPPQFKPMRNINLKLCAIVEA